MFHFKIPYAFLTFSICVLAGFSCNTNKNTIEMHSLVIELAESLNGKYITDTYDTYNPQNVGPSNKTLNQYSVDFKCSSKDFSKLEKLLASDSNVLEKQNTTKDKIQSYKSNGRVKTEPIRKNN